MLSSVNLLDLHLTSFNTAKLSRAAFAAGAGTELGKNTFVAFIMKHPVGQNFARNPFVPPSGG